MGNARYTHTLITMVLTPVTQTSPLIIKFKSSCKISGDAYFTIFNKEAS